MGIEEPSPPTTLTLTITLTLTLTLTRTLTLIPTGRAELARRTRGVLRRALPVLRLSQEELPLQPASAAPPQRTPTAAGRPPRLGPTLTVTLALTLTLTLPNPNPNPKP